MEKEDYSLKPGERDVTTTDLPEPKKGESDRFNEFAMGVKKAFRPDWLEEENKLFINKLNFVAKNFEDSYNSVSIGFFVTTNNLFVIIRQNN